jgi:hypothetical protein
LGEFAIALAVQLKKLPTIIERMRKSKYRIRQALETLSGVRLRRIVDPAGDTGAFLITIYEDPAIALPLKAILRVDAFETFFPNRRSLSWIEAVNSVPFLGEVHRIPIRGRNRVGNLLKASDNRRSL